jgi:hypothetical protein
MTGFEPGMVRESGEPGPKCTGSTGPTGNGSHTGIGGPIAGARRGRHVDSDSYSDSEREYSLSDSDSYSDYTTSDGATPISYGKKRHSRKLKSGMCATSGESQVVNPQLWAQSALGDEFATKKLTFSDMNYHQLIAGELGIITRIGISQSERNGRIHLLKCLTSLAIDHDFQLIKSVYGSVVHKIELDIFQWSDNFEHHVQWMVAKRPTTTVSKSIQKVPSVNVGKPSVYWCRDYQKGRCTLTDPHMIRFKGENVMAKHICARCYGKDGRVLGHPQGSGDCLYK